MEINEAQKQFLMTEYVQLRSEILLFMQNIENTERYALISSGAIWAWLATQKWNTSFVVVLVVPVLITIMFEKKRNSFALAINQAGEYIRRIEETIGVTNEAIGKLGWEHREKGDKKNDEKDDEKKHPFRKWRKNYWKLLHIGNIVIGVIYLISSLNAEYHFLSF